MKRTFYSPDRNAEVMTARSQSRQLGHKLRNPVML